MKIEMRNGDVVVNLGGSTDIITPKTARKYAKELQERADEADRVLRAKEPTQ